MKIAVTSTGPGLDDQVESRFGRCPYFLIIDSKTMAMEAIPNPNVSLGGGAGPQSAQLMAEKGVATVLTGNCGPNAFQTFGAAGIQVITGVNGQVREAVAQFNSGRLASSAQPNVQSHFGMGGGKKMGRGMGGGGGRGMGGGGGMGMGGGGGFRRTQGMGAGMAGGVQAQKAIPEADVPSAEAELEQLKATAEGLRNQLQAVEDQLKALSTKK